MQWFFLYCKVESAPCLDDLEHFKKLKKYGINLVEAENVDEYLSVIDNAEFLISGRFHHSIAAFMLDTPFISFKTNTRKMEAIISMFEKNNVLLKNNYLNSTLKLLKSDDFFMKNSVSKKEEIYRLAENNYVFLERK